jgi:hypothetical protein
MPLDVISNDRWRDAAGFEAKSAERFHVQLMPAPARPE